MSGLQPVQLSVNTETYIPERNTQASNIPLHLQEAAINTPDYNPPAGTLERVPERENNT